MPYEQPALFGVAYASRLFREYDYQSSYDEFVNNTNPRLDLSMQEHAQELLTWLNKWGCRIANEQFGQLIPSLSRWHEEQIQHLPPENIDISELEGNSFQRLKIAYEAMRNCGLGSTSAAKALFAVRPNCAIPWDKPIREKFELGDDGPSYRKMLELSCLEANELIVDAEKYGVHGVVEICSKVGSKESALAKLLDEYHWITMTRQHQIPSCDQLKKWVSWHP